MNCSGPGATHHLACDCRERKWAERLAGADRALYAERERVVRAELRAASLSQELLAARMARDCQRKAREEADAYAGRANARIADLGERLDATEAVLRDAEKARKEAERERDEARICIQIVRDRIERILAAWMRPPGGQEAGVPDKSISPQTCRELLRSLTAEQGSYTYEEWCRTTEAKAAAESRAARLEEKVRRIQSACGLPNPAEACRVVLAIAAEEGK